MLARAARTLARWAADPHLRLIFFVALAAIATLPWLLTAGGFNEFRDAQVLWLYEDQARRTVLDFGQLPLWNPDFCGGMPALGTPQARFASPTFLLSLVFGTTRAEPLLIFVMVLVALYGAFALARDHGATRAGATLGAPLFGLLGTFACAPFLGWFGFLGFAFLPWILLGVRRAARGQLSGLALVGLSTGFIVGFGGTYVAPISLVACLVELVLLFVRRGRARLNVGFLAAAALLAVGLSAYRLWPVWEELERGPRVIAGMSVVGLQLMGASLFGTTDVWNGEVWYLVTIPGAIVAALALRRARGRWLAISLLFFLWLAAGNAMTPSLYALLRQIPVFSLLRNSERFLVCAGLVLSIAVSLAVTDVLGRFRVARRSPRVVKLDGVLAAIAALGLVLATAWQLHNFTVAASKRTLGPPPRELVQPFHQARGNRWAAGGFGPMSRGSLACWEAYGVPQSPKLRGDLTDEAWLADPTAGALESTRWSPNALGFHARLERPTRVVINQNYHRGWKSDVGAVVNTDGLLSVELPAGEADLTLRFLPRSAVGGLVVSALALIALTLISLSRLTGLRQLWVATLPLLAGAVLSASSDEPAHVRPELTGPEGEAVVVDVLPLESKLLEVQFAEGVKLAGGSVTWRPHDDRIRVELDWSRAADVNRNLGIFLHLEPGTLKRVGADHLQLSDAIFLEQLPVGAIGRDILLVDVPDAKRGPAWNVWVGLWEMRGDGHRVQVTNANGVTSAENRVLVGSVQVPPKVVDGGQP